MLARAFVLMLGVAGCGRIGFESKSGPITGTDATTITDGPTGDGPCQQVAPFLAIVAITPAPSSAGFLDTTWCSDGLAGPLTGTLITQATLATRDEHTVPIADHAMQFLLGGQSCDCFVRLTANGVTVESAPMLYLGD